MKYLISKLKFDTTLNGVLVNTIDKVQDLKKGLEDGDLLLVSYEDFKNKRYYNSTKIADIVVGKTYYAVSIDGFTASPKEILRYQIITIP